MSNLPPGCTENMIPGNRPEDMRYEKFIDDCGGDLAAEFLELQTTQDILKEMLMDTILLEDEFSDYCNKRFEEKEDTDGA